MKNNSPGFKDEKAKAQEVQITWMSHTAGEEVSVDWRPALSSPVSAGLPVDGQLTTQEEGARSTWRLTPDTYFIRTGERGCLEAYVSQEERIRAV